MALFVLVFLLAQIYVAIGQSSMEIIVEPSEISFSAEEVGELGILQIPVRITSGGSGKIYLESVKSSCSACTVTLNQDSVEYSKGMVDAVLGLGLPGEFIAGYEMQLLFTFKHSETDEQIVKAHNIIVSERRDYTLSPSFLWYTVGSGAVESKAVNIATENRVDKVQVLTSSHAFKVDVQQVSDKFIKISAAPQKILDKMALTIDLLLFEPGGSVKLVEIPIFVK